MMSPPPVSDPQSAPAPQPKKDRLIPDTPDKLENDHQPKAEDVPINSESLVTSSEIEAIDVSGPQPVADDGEIVPTFAQSLPLAHHLVLPVWQMMLQMAFCSC